MRIFDISKKYFEVKCNKYKKGPLTNLTKPDKPKKGEPI